MREERLKPGLEFVLPSQRGAHGSPPTEMPQPKKPSGTKRFPAPAKVVLKRIAKEGLIFERTADLILTKRHWGTRAEELRAAIDDHFKAEFERGLDDWRRQFGENSELVKNTMPLFVSI